MHFQHPRVPLKHTKMCNFFLWLQSLQGGNVLFSHEYSKGVFDAIFYPRSTEASANLRVSCLPVLSRIAWTAPKGWNYNKTLGGKCELCIHSIHSPITRLVQGDIYGGFKKRRKLLPLLWSEIPCIRHHGLDLLHHILTFKTSRKGELI